MAVRAQGSSFPFLSDHDLELLFTDMSINLSAQERTDIIMRARNETDGIVIIFECMLSLAQKLFGCESESKADALLQKLNKMYLSPMSQQCNWLLYRDRGKVWLPQKSLLIDHNLALLREMYNLFLDEGKYTFQSALQMFEKSQLVVEFSDKKFEHIFQKSILTEKISQLPQQDRYLVFVEFISFVVRVIAEAYSSPASDKYHESEIRKLFFGFNEIGTLFGLTFTKPKKLDEGIAKQIKIETLEHQDDSDIEDLVKPSSRTGSKHQTTLTLGSEGSKEDKSRVEVNVSTIEQETTPENLK